MRLGHLAICLAGLSAFALGLPFALARVQGDEGDLRLAAREAGGPCLPGFALSGARIVALGAYQGGLPTSAVIEGASHQVRAITVAAEPSGPPLVLIVTAYDPVVWDFSHFPLGRLRAVIVYGYHPQALAHLPERVPARFTIGPGANGSCGRPLSAHEGGTELEALDAQARAVLHRPIDSFVGAYEPAGLGVEGHVRIAAPPRHSSAGIIRRKLPTVPDPVGPHEAEIQRLVREGALRPARKDDLDAWNAAATRHSPTGHLAPVRAKSMSLGRAFVVLRPISLPAGMHGFDSRDFIIPPGVAAPIDAGSFNSYYFIADGTCRAPGDEC